MKAYDLKGRRFGKLVAVEKVKVGAHASWKCQCDCGREKIIRTAYLLRRGYRCCGCEKNFLSNIHRIMNSYKNGARSRGLSWTLTREEVIALVTKNCFFCDGQPSNGSVLITLKYNGIDRLDNKKGYETANCVPCCTWCNKGKMNKTVTQFIDWVNSVSQNMATKPIDPKLAHTDST